MRGGMDLRFWGADHSFDHLQVWTTWELWTLRHEKARFSDEKAPKSTQNEAKDCYCFLWDVDAAGSHPVTPTKSKGGEHKLSPFAFGGGDGENLLRACGKAKA